MKPFDHTPPILRLNPYRIVAGEDRLPGARLGPDKVAAVRRMVEDTPLSFRAIARQCGVSLASVSRLATRHDWQRRHVQASAVVLTSRQRQDERFARLSDRILGLAEESVEFLDSARANATPAEIEKAMRLLRLARKAVEEERRGKRRKRRTGR
jgi:hypothetical protein